ncbi:MAG: hypothetical protein ABIH46_04825 [Chloroflexota bacterium]
MADLGKFAFAFEQWRQRLNVDKRWRPRFKLGALADRCARITWWHGAWECDIELDHDTQDKDLDETACHEVLHLVLADLRRLFRHVCAEWAPKAACGLVEEEYDNQEDRIIEQLTTAFKEYVHASDKQGAASQDGSAPPAGQDNGRRVESVQDWGHV